MITVWNVRWCVGNARSVLVKGMVNFGKEEVDRAGERCGRKIDEWMLCYAILLLLLLLMVARLLWVDMAQSLVAYVASHFFPR